jgi:hypothetical protein
MLIIMSNLSVSKVPRKTKNNPQPTLSENFNSHPLYVKCMVATSYENDKNYVNKYE